MKLHNLPFLFLLVFAGCTSQKNTNEFIQTTSGRYLFNANEVLEIYFQDQLLYVKWRGNDQISPLKINDSTFEKTHILDNIKVGENGDSIKLIETFKINFKKNISVKRTIKDKWICD